VRIGIVGAGFAGLSAAKVLTEFGHEVRVFDKTPDVGGVWSRTRRYPGVTTQNNKASYAFSDFPMPRAYPEWPTGEQVQSYLAGYVRRFRLEPYLWLNTEVIHADLDDESGLWTLETRRTGASDVHRYVFEFLVVANGIFSDPLIPSFDGVEEFRRAGGWLCHTSEFDDLGDASGKHVVVVGYGKSSCDVAVAISDVAVSTTVVARDLIWKMPKKLAKVLNYKYLILTRTGESLFPYIDAEAGGRFRQGPGRVLGKSMFGGVQSLVTRQLGLRPLGLVPGGSFADIARSTVSLATDRFYDQVAEGGITVHRDCVITRLLAREGRPAAELSTGEIIPADAVVCGTGFHQRVPFLDPRLQQELTDERGNFELYRQILPLTVSKLAFAGYNSSLFSPLSAEIAALWIASYLTGTLELPPVEARRAHVQKRLRWMEERTQGKHARGTNIIPFSMHNIDEMLTDVGLDVGRATRLRQWLLPVNPRAYRDLAVRVRRRHELPEDAGAEAQTGDLNSAPRR
jgi:dimethylaniline monooxygenase (N-oxide forming)